MHLIFDAQRQGMMIEFRPLKKGQVLNDRREILPGVWLFFNFHGQLMQVEITQASRHGPELSQFVQLLVTEIMAQVKNTPQELLLSSTGPLNLSGEERPLPVLKSEDLRLFYDSAADVLQIELRRLQPGEVTQPPREMNPGVYGFFDQEGQMMRLEIHQGMRLYPALKAFVDQGHELLAAEKMLRTFGRR